MMVVRYGIGSRCGLGMRRVGENWGRKGLSVVRRVVDWICVVTGGERGKKGKRS